MIKLYMTELEETFFLFHFQQAATLKTATADGPRIERTVRGTGPGTAEEPPPAAPVQALITLIKIA